MTDKIPQLSRVRNRITVIESVSDMMNHLVNFRNEVSMNIHAMPGILRGVPCHQVVESSVELMDTIDRLKKSLDKVQKKKYLRQSRRSVSPSKKEPTEYFYSDGSSSEENNRTIVPSETMVELVDKTVVAVEAMLQNFDDQSTVEKLSAQNSLNNV